jgi:hypothetical protein
MRGRAQGCTLPIPIGSTASVNGVTGLREAVGFVSVQPSHSWINKKALCMRRDVHHRWHAALGRAPTGSSWAIAVNLLRRLIRPPRSHIAEGWQLCCWRKALACYARKSTRVYSTRSDWQHSVGQWSNRTARGGGVCLGAAFALVHQRESALYATRCSS